MSNRETRTKPLTLLQVGGVNQRVRATELKLHEYVTLNGVFPEFAGLQSRIWGKRLHKLYDEAVYGIHQFWTPMGYGGGVYQFDGKVDFGQWLTPNSSFDLTIPPLELDGGGMTLDEFGLSFGSNFGYGTTNVCLISFLNGSSDHSACLLEMNNVDTPDDSNGSPAGQGKSCGWEETFTDMAIDLFVVAKSQSSGTTYNVTDITNNVGNPETSGGACVLAPPNPPTIGPDVAFDLYLPVILTGSLSSSQSLLADWSFVPGSPVPGCTATVTVHRYSGVPTVNHRATVNFAALQNQNVQRITMLITRLSGSIEVPIAAGEIGLQGDINIDMLTYREQGVETHPSFGTTQRFDSASASQFRVYYRERVCS